MHAQNAESKCMSLNMQMQNVYSKFMCSNMQMQNCFKGPRLTHATGHALGVSTFLDGNV